MINKACFLLFVFGIALISAGLTLPTYHNEEKYQAEYAAIDVMPVPEGKVVDYAKASKDFHALRKKYLTKRYPLIDYGSVLFLLGLTLLIISRAKNKFRSPRTKKGFIALAVAVWAATCASEYFTFIIGLSRGEYPHWADSLGIGLATLLIQAPIIAFWILLQLLVLILSRNFLPNQPLNPRFSLRTAWFLLLASISALFLLVDIAFGIPTHIIALLLWTYLYLSLSAGIPPKSPPAVANV